MCVQRTYISVYLNKTNSLYIINYGIIYCLSVCVFVQHKLSDETSYHVKSVEVESKEKPFSVMINGDHSTITENVTK